ncbi:2-keto-4-pentenoate hydratase [Flexithrix dorotheae]|uniref:2-keto-4-pentenoate hydratase n=1 Tax=Flexithrix dorotheae TaxID=70993 RepID=UPI00035D9B62|nr:fumarylacetoacetate hydrolase family protein [Flexithrix dorotheae]
MKTFSPFQIFSFSLLLIYLASCSSPEKKQTEETPPPAAKSMKMSEEQLVDSLQFYRENAIITDLLSRENPDLERELASKIQLRVLEKELAKGKTKIGWKMGGTATSDPAQFDPVFGYILNTNMIAPNSSVPMETFPGGGAMVEAEVGFIIKNDLKEGLSSMDDAKSCIEYVVGAIEFAKSIATTSNGTQVNPAHVLATGMGQAGTIVGTVKIPASDFDFENETAKCFINGKLAAKGVASNIYGNPLNALYELANLLPKYGQYLKAGDLVITGSLYANPTIDDAAEVKVEFSNLGTISFKTE